MSKFRSYSVDTDNINTAGWLAWEENNVLILIKGGVSGGGLFPEIYGTAYTYDAAPQPKPTLEQVRKLARDTKKSYFNNPSIGMTKRLRAAIDKLTSHDLGRT